ncbi:MAG TPA: DinB family protein, partial [Gemmatimonadales bacterium]|nr:DinB family protein [Gemmatimonadales bacterium]
PIQGFDQDRWAERFDYAGASADRALALLAPLRAANLALWRTAEPADLQRVGLHSERGEESFGLMLRLMAAHDLVHRRQIERILGGPAAGPA